MVLGFFPAQVQLFLGTRTVVIRFSAGIDLLDPNSNLRFLVAAPFLLTTADATFAAL
jgi:hypothetical protein